MDGGLVMFEFEFGLLVGERVDVGVEVMVVVVGNGDVEDQRLRNVCIM